MTRFLAIISIVWGISMAHFSYSSVATAVTDGQWSSTTTWSPGVPGCYDTIIIPAGITVNVDDHVDLMAACSDSVFLMVYGTLTFSTGKKLSLPCGSDVVVFPGGSIMPGGGGGNSNYIEMCNTVYWNAGDGPLFGPSELCDGGCPPSQLPIELLYFTAKLNDNTRKADLHWATASEIDNDYFTVERSANGEDWIEILQVDGAGNSSVQLEYFEVDAQPLIYGDSYYQLKQTDFDGDFSYSPIVRLSSDGTTEFIMYPNPVDQDDQVVLTFPDNTRNPVEVVIYSIEGKLIYQATYDISDSYQIILDVGVEFQSGMYLVKTELISAKLIVK
ncbi:MAG: T9SS type A sorting domain-containing protein [Crocinitomicaceae bacterium]|nr:T9SS type A sorting domain-containing protein [Crocinitomicaceae bacterium]